VLKSHQFGKQRKRENLKTKSQTEIDVVKLSMTQFKFIVIGWSFSNLVSTLDINDLRLVAAEI
jgi:hypothetical protein